MAFCANCGTEVSAEAAACPQCGHPRRRARRTEGNAVAALILGIAGIVVCPLVCSILAIIFGNQAQSRIAADPELEGDGMARAGIILGWVGVGLCAIAIGFFVLVFAFSAGSGF